MPTISPTRVGSQTSRILFDSLDADFRQPVEDDKNPQLR
jgi:hypothetical protein